MITRRAFLRSIVAIAAAHAIPIHREELRRFANMADIIPLGSIFGMWNGNGGVVHVIKGDHGFIELNGSELSRKHFPELFAVLGTTYGESDGGMFRIPDMRWKAPDPIVLRNYLEDARREEDHGRS